MIPIINFRSAYRGSSKPLIQHNNVRKWIHYIAISLLGFTSFSIFLQLGFMPVILTALGTKLFLYLHLGNWRLTGPRAPHNSCLSLVCHCGVTCVSLWCHSPWQGAPTTTSTQLSWEQTVAPPSGVQSISPGVRHTVPLYTNWGKKGHHIHGSVCQREEPLHLSPLQKY